MDHRDREEREDGMDLRDRLDCAALTGHWDPPVSLVALASLVRLASLELLGQRETWAPPETRAALACRVRGENQASLACLGSLAKWDPRARTAATEKKEDLAPLGPLDHRVFQVPEANLD